MNTLIPLVVGLNVPRIFSNKNDIGIKITHEGWYVMKQRNQPRTIDTKLLVVTNGSEEFSFLKIQKF